MGSWVGKSRRYGLLTALLFCASTALALALAEVGARLVLRVGSRAGFYIWPTNYRALRTPSPAIMPGISGPSDFITNSHGLRSDEPAAHHQLRVLALGGSTTICDYLDQAEAWPQLLQTELSSKTSRNVWVGNGGLSGLNTRHHVVALEHLPLDGLEIDAVVLLTGINDLGKRLAHDEDYDPRLPTTQEDVEQLLAETFTGTFDSRPSDPAIKKTALWRLLRKVKGQLMEGGTRQDEDGRIYLGWREHRRNAREVREHLPDLSSALDEYARNLDRIVDIARRNSIRLVLVTQPTLWKPGLPADLEKLLWLGGVGDFQQEPGQPYYSVAALDAGMRAYNAVLLRTCAARQVECIDLASMLEKDTTTFYDDVHFNEEGARKVARLLSTYLVEPDGAAE